MKEFKCKLQELRPMEKMGTEFVFVEKDSNKEYVIKVDESIFRIINRFKEHFAKKRENIYLTKGMTNIDIYDDGKNNEFNLYDEKLEVYTFSKDDFLDIVYNQLKVGKEVIVSGVGAGGVMYSNKSGVIKGIGNKEGYKPIVVTFDSGEENMFYMIDVFINN